MKSYEQAKYVEFVLLWLYKIQMNLFANFQKSDTTSEASEQEKDQKIKQSQQFQNWVEAIYEQKTTISQLYLISEEVEVNLQMDQMHTIIKNQLQIVCKGHRNLIEDSVEVICRDKLSICRINAEDYFQIEPLDDEEYDLQIKQSVVWIIYQHFCSICQCNKQICLLWEIINNNIDGAFMFKLINDHWSQLKEDNLNQFALKELIPNSQFIKHKNFKAILESLLQSPFIAEKAHLEDLYRVYRKSEINIKSRIKTKTMKISMEIDPTQKWFEKVKEEKIAQKLFSRLGFDCDLLLNEEKHTLKEENKLTNDRLYKNTILESQIESLKFLPKEQNKLAEDFLCKNTILQSQIESLKFLPREQKPVTTEPSKKKKNKKKKKKKVSITPDKKAKKQQNQEKNNNNINKNGQQNTYFQKMLSTTPSMSQIQKQQHEKTVRMFQDMTINDSQRIPCNISEINIQKWFKQIRTQHL